MSDLISRKAAIDAVNVGNLHPGIISSLKSIIEEIPSAEECISVVRCKDCKHRVVNENYGKRGYLRIPAYCERDSDDIFALGRNAYDDDWFCADAELKEESKGGE